MSKTRIISAVSIICTLFIGMVIYSYRNTQNKIEKIALHTEEIYGDIEFSGKVDSIIKIRREGRAYGLMCVDLDYSNVESFYRFDKYTTLKIKNKKAIIPIGPLGDISNRIVNFKLNADYVKVSKGDLTTFFIGENDSIVVESYFRNNNLKEEDLLRCGY